MNFHIYPSPFTNESRMLREIESIIEMNLADEVVVAGIQSGGLPKDEIIGAEARLIRFKTVMAHPALGKLGKALGLLEYLVRTLVWGFIHRPATVNCHSLNVLVVGVLLRKLGRTKWLIYDAHELETEREALGGIPQKVSRRVECWLIPSVDHLIVVCKPIADWYEKAYPAVELTTIRNIPLRSLHTEHSTVLRQNFNISNNDMIFIYQGVLSKARGVAQLLDAFSAVPPNRHIVFMGYGPAEREIIEAAKRHPNIHFQAAVNPDQIVAYTASADVGLFFLEDNISLSYQYSLPNKFFEYLYAGCSIIVSSSLTYLSQLTNEHGLGRVVDSDTVSLIACIEAVTRDDIDLGKTFREKFVSANSWSTEKSLYRRAYGK